MNEVYEIEYVKENGKWKILKVHWCIKFNAPVDSWTDRQNISSKKSPASFKPDGEGETSGLYPSAFILPFHYKNSVTVKDELERFLEGRDKQAYLAALKATATSAHWTEIKGAVEIAKASPANDATIYRIIENLKATMLIEDKENIYRINDPMLRTLLLTSQIT